MELAAAADAADAAQAARAPPDPEACRVAATVLHAPPARQPRLPTGLPAVDGALGGGLPPHQVVEVVGPPASGKTTLCCAASAQAAARGTVLFVETKGASVAERLQQRVAPQQGQQHVLGNVRVADVHTMDDLLLLLTQLLDTLEGGADEAGLQLLVIDCFADLALPRVHAHPRETGLVCAATRLLPQIAQRLGGCVLLTNSTVRGDSESEPHKAALKAIAGPSAPQLRLVLSPSGETHGVIDVHIEDAIDAPAGGRGTFELGG